MNSIIIKNNTETEDKWVLQKEIDEIIREHNRRRARGRRIWIICGMVALVLLIVFSVHAGHVRDEQPGPYESLAGSYTLCDLDIEDPFGFPEGCTGAGSINIDDKGNIEFPYYNGGAYENGNFYMIKGQLTRYQYGDHDFNIEFNREDTGDVFLHTIYLDMEGERLKLHEESSKNGNDFWYREFNLYYRDYSEDLE